MSPKSKLLLSIVLLRDLHNKVRYYKTIIENNIKRLELAARYDLKWDKVDVNKELQNLKDLRSCIEIIDIFLEEVIIRLETLVLSERMTLSVMLIKEFLKELKYMLGSSIPTMDIYIDRLNSITNDLVHHLQFQQSKKEVIVASDEAKRIIKEIKAFLRMN
ncbi:MAG: hypothetical protein LM572_00525 [Ignisphaera sp.]|jgi:hypothetical protein|nr:hypothetical protein [Ignisphaera sp.]MCC6055175.1 hypothetical protein [Desulfurococcaceae archaeon]